MENQHKSRQLTNAKFTVTGYGACQRDRGHSLVSLERLLGRAVKKDEAHVLRFHRQDKTKQTDKTKNKLESNVNFGLEARSAEDRHAPAMGLLLPGEFHQRQGQSPRISSF